MQNEASLFTRCSLLVEIHSLLVTRCKITRHSMRSSLVTHCRGCSLQKVTRHSLQKLLVAKNHSFLVAKFACYSLKKLLVAKNHSLLVAKFVRCSLKWSHFLQLYEKVTPAQVFSCEFSRNFKNNYCVEHLRTAASENNIKRQQTFNSFLRQSSFSF